MKIAPMNAPIPGASNDTDLPLRIRMNENQTETAPTFSSMSPVAAEKTQMNPTEAATAYLEIHGRRPSLTKFAKEAGLVRMTLARHVFAQAPDWQQSARIRAHGRGEDVRPLVLEKGGRPTYMTDAGRLLVACAMAREMGALANNCTTASVGTFMQEAMQAGQLPSRKTVVREIKRMEKLKLVQPGTEMVAVKPQEAAKVAVDPELLRNHLKDFHQKIYCLQTQITDLRDKPHFNRDTDILNCDETMICFGDDRSPKKVYALPGVPYAAHIRARLNAHITMFTVIRIDGTKAPPLIITDGYEADFRAAFKVAMPDAYVAVSEKGFINGTLFNYLLKRSVEYFRAGRMNERPSLTAADLPMVLISDNHSTCWHLDAAETYKNMNIVPSILPANSTDRLQPLDADNGPHQRLKAELKRLTQYHEKEMSADDAAGFIAAAFDEAYETTVIANAFIHTGYHRSWGDNNFRKIDTLWTVHDKAIESAKEKLNGCVAVALEAAQRRKKEEIDALRPAARNVSSALKKTGIPAINGYEFLAMVRKKADAKEAEEEEKRNNKREREEKKKKKEEEAAKKREEQERKKYETRKRKEEKEKEKENKRHRTSVAAAEAVLASVGVAPIISDGEAEPPVSAEPQAAVGIGMPSEENAAAAMVVVLDVTSAEPAAESGGDRRPNRKRQ